MSKKILYYSTDKLYKIKKVRISKKALFVLSIIATLILSASFIICFKEAVTINAKNSDIGYNEIGKVNYKVYLKDNNYYETSYLKSGMQYVASLIKTVNVKFDYQMHTTEDISFDNRYKVTAELQITERDAPTKILYQKEENIVKEKTTKTKDDNLVINEEIDIDYNKYNSIVNSYKRDLGLVVSSNLIITFDTNTTGTYKKDTIQKDNKLQIIIPISEATLQIKMNTNEINNSGVLGQDNTLFRIDNLILFVISILLILLMIGSLLFNIYVYFKYFKKDIYKTTVNKILRDYDRLIVKGKVNIDEKKYSNCIITENFDEMVDAAQNLGVPILYYEPIPNEKSFFVVIKDDTLYKYRLTKAFLERNPNNKVEKEISKEETEVI